MKHPSYTPLNQAVMAPDCCVLDAHNPPPVRADSPALEVMTDLAKIPVATIEAEDLLSDANQSMLLRGVRLLMVTDATGAIDGVITSADFLGGKPVSVAKERGKMRHELQVKDVMTPLDKLEVLLLADVAHARVGDIVATLKAVSRVHALVVEEESGRQVLRGIFSASQIARQLGIHLFGHDAARTFAEIDAVIADV